MHTSVNYANQMHFNLKPAYKKVQVRFRFLKKKFWDKVLLNIYQWKIHQTKTD